MKYALLFAATAAASYDAYGGYGGAESSSAPAKLSPSAVVSPSAAGYGGYGAKPVPSSKAPSVVSSAAAEATPCSTSVGQNGYTTVAPGYGKPPVTVTSQYQAIPTCLAKGYDGKSCEKWGEDKYVSTIVTDYDKNVVTVTDVKECVTVYHEKKTITHYATPTLGGYAAPSSAPMGAKNSTGNWYELYEKIYVVEYENLGKNSLPGYGGSGLCHECDNAQPVTVKQCKSGKCTEEKKVMNYGSPKEEVKVYEKPGVYTVPAKVVTVYPSAPTGAASYGNGNGKAPEAGVYTYEAKIITITKPNQEYTCTWEAPKQTPSKGDEYPASATQTPSHGEEYPAASSTPNAPENKYPSYPSYPVKSNGTSYGNGYSNAPSSTPCTESETLATPTPASTKPVEYGNTASSSAPVYGDNGYGAQSTPVAASSMPVEYSQAAYSAPAEASSTPCESDLYTPAASATPAPVYGDNYPSPAAPAEASSTPCESDLQIPTPAPIATPSPYVPGYGDNQPSSVPAYGGEMPSPTIPAAASSTPCDETETPAATPYSPAAADNYPAPTPSAPVSDDNDYGYGGENTPAPMPVAPGSDNTPAPTPVTPGSDNNDYGYGSDNTPAPTPASYPSNGGYTKRISMAERRNKRVLVL